MDQYQVGGPPEKLHQVSLNHASFCCERPFTCPIDGCQSSYRRKDHLARHLRQHEGKLFECPFENCNRSFAFEGNIKRHVKEFHNEESSSDIEGPKQYVCQEDGCGKVFKFASKLQKHEDSHVKLDSVEAICCEPGCMKHFSNSQCLKDHILSCHQYITCEKCGAKQLKKNIKRHLRTHEERGSLEKHKCSFVGCLRTYSTKSNLNQHVKAVHLESKPFACSIPGCGMRFSFKHVRDTHEKTGRHVYTPGDFEEADEQFSSRPRGGRKRKCPPIESLVRKRVSAPSQTDSILNQGAAYLSWMLLADSEDER
ncbi:transcription factor IIIA isoform X2 [Malania oleifera]|uniref:transcription factor IIIA isoform X2 n=1 Tax=Malania oleifera TaxID=397392 RepID=UPI0025ADC8F9|nr:transcription factor IIIA isoform X2 [Malania oleifera]